MASEPERGERRRRAGAGRAGHRSASSGAERAAPRPGTAAGRSRPRGGAGGPGGERRGWRRSAAATRPRCGRRAAPEPGEQRAGRGVELLLDAEAPGVEQRQALGVGAEIVELQPEEDVGDRERGRRRSSRRGSRSSSGESQARPKGTQASEHDGERGQDAPGPALVEAGEREAALAQVAHEDAGDQEAGDDEEDVDAEIAAGEGGKPAWKRITGRTATARSPSMSRRWPAGASAEGAAAGAVARPAKGGVRSVRIELARVRQCRRECPYAAAGATGARRCLTARSVHVYARFCYWSGERGSVAGYLTSERIAGHRGAACRGRAGWWRRSSRGSTRPRRTPSGATCGRWRRRGGAGGSTAGRCRRAGAGRSARGRGSRRRRRRRSGRRWRGWWSRG